MDIKGTLTHKIGPLPAIGWAGIAGGIFVGFRYWKAKNATDTSTNVGADVAPVANGLPGVGDSSDFSQGYSDAAGSYVVGTSGNTSTASQVYTEPAAATNNDYGKRALNWLIAQGVNPQDASTALSSYLYSTGEALNDTQSAALNEAITHFGAPPEGIIAPPPVVTTPPVVNTPTTAAPTDNGFGNGSNGQPVTPENHNVSYDTPGGNITNVGGYFPAGFFG